MSDPLRDQILIEKIRGLPAEKVAAVEDFVDFLRHRDSEESIARAASQLSEDALRKVWDNPEDAVYDRL